MTTRHVSDFLQRLRRTLQRRAGAERTDGQLLRDFLTRREETAVAALVSRHGPMVWGVCQRMLPNHHDAEDAFQATFLVLVRKAATVQPPEMVANWLYGVAYQTALKARSIAIRRQTRERQVSVMPDPATGEPEKSNDLHLLLDQKLSRLPDKYRVVILLCDLEGKTRQEAAAHLGWPEGTVAGRLARGRAMLAKRLSRYGLATAGAVLAGTLPSTATACVPETVATATIKTASLVAAGQAGAAGTVSVQVATLTEGVIKTMLLGKLKFLGVVLTCVLGSTMALHVVSLPTMEPGNSLAQVNPAAGATGPGKKARHLPAAKRTPPSPLHRFFQVHLTQIHNLIRVFHP
jgi:RNA polymerase sigma factor (sigma-70 family)